MSSWLAAVSPALCILALLYLPGGLLAAAARLRGLLIIGVAPVLSLAIIGVSAILYGTIGASWGLHAVLILGLGLAGLTLGIGAATTRALPPAPFRLAGRALLVTGSGALVVSALVFVVQYVVPVGDASNYGQLQDTMFHFSVVQWILDTGIGSSTQTGLVDGSIGASHFYPSAWHDTVALAVSISGSSIPVATSAFTAIISIVVLPIGAMSLGRVLFGAQTLPIFAIGALSTGIGAFPWRFLSFGVLYSNHLAMSALPGVIALVIWLCRTRGRPGVSFWFGLALVPVLLAGLALAQPNTLFGLAVYILPLALPLIWSWTARVQKQRMRWFIGWVAALAGAVVLFWAIVFNLPFMQRTVNWSWPPFETLPRAVGEVLLNGYNDNPGQPVITLLVIVGAVVAFRKRQHLWLVFSYAVFGFLYVLSASSDSTFRNVLTGFWYHDSFRLAAFASLAALPLAALGAVASVRWAQDLMRGVPRFARIGAAVGTASVLLVAIVVVNLGTPGMVRQRSLLGAAFRPEDGFMLDQRETAFLAEVADAVPDGALVANNPYDGSGLAYPFFGLHVLFTSMDGNWLGTWGEPNLEVARGLNDLDTDPTVCAASEELGVDYLLQLNEHLYSVYGEDPNWGGLRVTDETPGFDLVLTDGTSGLYRLTECQ